MATGSPVKKIFLVLLIVVVLAIPLKLVLNYCLIRFPRRSGVQVTISKETTYIIEPLTADGYPDYIAALNDRGSQGGARFQGHGPRASRPANSRPILQVARHRSSAGNGRLFRRS
jgi:hypothetical protein